MARPAELSLLCFVSNFPTTKGAPILCDRLGVVARKQFRSSLLSVCSWFMEVDHATWRVHINYGHG